MAARPSRRSWLTGGLAAIGSAAASRVLAGWPSSEGDRPVSLPALDPRRPDVQHAWNDVLAVDGYGNPELPRHHRLVFFAVAGVPGPADVRRAEAALRAVETAFPRHPAGGLLLTVGWGPGYFTRHTPGPPPLPPARRLSGFEAPVLDDHDLCLHLSADDERRLVDVEQALRGEGGPLAGDVPPLGQVLAWRETRAGFSGAGMPAERGARAGADVTGVPEGAPLFLGFRSGFRRNQATEDDVIIAEGPLAGGATMHVSQIRLRLGGWYGMLDADQRAARMFSPRTTAAAAEAMTDEAPTAAAELAADARRHGVVGHLQAAAGARRGDRPLILRRDFATVLGRQPGLNFVSIQRSIEDFETTRRAMNAAGAPHENTAIGPTQNNGINEFMLVLRRANFLLPPRGERAFPLLRDRERGLE